MFHPELRVCCLVCDSLRLGSQDVARDTSDGCGDCRPRLELGRNCGFAKLEPMKKICPVTIFTLALLFAPQIVLSQGTVYLSNLGEYGAGFSVGGGDQSFETGVFSNGYILNSVSLLMGEWLGLASNFDVSLFSDNSGQTGTFLGNLNGNADPETAGQYVYTASDIILNSTTTYWIVATCNSSSPGPQEPPGGYTWQITSSPGYISSDGWNIDTFGISSSAGNGYFLQFSVNATPAPEPSALGLLALGGLFFRFRRSS